MRFRSFHYRFFSNLKTVSFKQACLLALFLTSPASYAGLVFDTSSPHPLLLMSTDPSCAEGKSPHWECGGQYQPPATATDGTYIAVCPSGASGYSECSETHEWVLFENLDLANGVLNCTDESYLGQGRSSCQYYVGQSSYVSAAEVYTYPSYTLNVVNEGNGLITSTGNEIDCGADCDELLGENSTVALTAQADAGFEFVGWTGDCTSINTETQNCVVAMDADKTVSATFNLIPTGLPSAKADNQYPLILQATTACSEGASPHWECGGQFLPVENLVSGSYVGVCPTGASAYGDCVNSATNPHMFVLFENLDLNTHGVLPHTNEACSGLLRSACFNDVGGSDYIAASEMFELGGNVTNYTLTVNAQTDGTIVSSGNEINCGVDCDETLAQGSEVTLTAQANEGFEFVSWTGDCTSINTETQNCVVAMDADKTVSATFNLIPTGLPSAKADNQYPLILQATTACSEGASPHWECGGQFLPVENLVSGSYVGVCPTGASDYGTCVNSTTAPHKFVLFDNLDLTSDGVLGHTNQACSGLTRSQCFDQVIGTNYVAASDVFETDGGSTTTPTTDFTLTVTANTNGVITSTANEINCGVDCNETLAENSQLTLVTQANQGFEFTNWTGDCSGSGSCVVTFDADKNVGAVFTAVNTNTELPPVKSNNLHSLILQSSNCSEGASPHYACGGQYHPADNLASGSYIAVCPTGASDYSSCANAEGADKHKFILFEDIKFSDGVLVCSDASLVGQSRNDCAQTAGLAQYVYAAEIFDFGDAGFTLSVTSNENGTVTAPNNDINCGADCSESYGPGALVTLTPIADANYHFEEWHGACSGREECVVTMTGNLNVTASFIHESLADLEAPTITVAGNNPEVILLDETYTDLGATCNDNLDGNISNLPVTSNVDTSALGNYVVEYRCQDFWGNESIVERTVNVVGTLGTGELNTSVTLVADSEITASNSEVVTFGLPLKEGVISHTRDIRVELGGIELPVYTESGMRWHWKENSLRSITIQLQNIDMSNGNVDLIITNNGRNNNNDLEKQAFPAGWVSSGTNKANMQYPRVFALHNQDYLADSKLIPPFVTTQIGTEYDLHYKKQHQEWNSDYVFDDTHGNSPWLFDRPTTYFKHYMGTSDIESRVAFLKEAILSKQFYFDYIRNDGSQPAAAGGSGSFTFGTTLHGDGKYIQTQSAKLAWALVGDNSQWDMTLIKNMDLQARIGDSQPYFRYPFDSEDEHFTERSEGLVNLNGLNAYEITGDESIRSHLETRIGYLQQHMNLQDWDVINGWPEAGYWRHSFERHENLDGIHTPGDADDMGSSPWMTQIVIDFLWQYHNQIGDFRIPAMFVSTAKAVEEWGFTHNYDTVTDTYTREVDFENAPPPNHYVKNSGCNSRPESEQLYFMSDIASNSATGRLAPDKWRDHTDGHTEVVLGLALAYLYETDPIQKEKYEARIRVVMDARFPECAHNLYVGEHDPTDNSYRLFNWQHGSNSIRTWRWVQEQANQAQ